jgi:hypothetical protein
MRAALRASAWVSLFALAFLAGCSDTGTNPVSTPSTDQALISAVVTLAPSLVQDGLMNSSAQTALAPALQRAGSATVTPIDPVTFWRDVQTATHDFSIAFADTDDTGYPTTAVVTVSWDFAGTLNIVETGGGLDHPIQKPFSDHWVRNVLMKRLPSNMDGIGHHDWRIAGISGVDVTSPSATTQITSVNLHDDSGLDTTLTDPLVITHLHDLMRFPSGDSITVTVTTGRDGDVVLLYHADHRERMANLGGGMYSAVLPAGEIAGWRHFAVNALSNGTLYDDTVAYDSKAWIFPYVISTTAPVDYVP